MPVDDAPLPEDWSEIDSQNVFYEYIRLCKEERREGKPIPAMFRSMREREE